MKQCGTPLPDYLRERFNMDGLSESFVAAFIEFVQREGKNESAVLDDIGSFLESTKLGFRREEAERLIMDEHGAVIVAVISKEMLRKGIGEVDENGRIMNTGIIRFIPDPLGCGGTVAKIGDYWFYFGGRVPAETPVEEFLESEPAEAVVDGLSDALEGIASDVNTAEYMYYYYVLLKNDNKPGDE